MSRKDIFAKHLPNIRLATRFDAEGREIEVEIREDVEQTRKQQEIFDILVGCGYFRAYIKGLSAFNKIVGGMVWCMESCDHDVDVDLLFDENLSIGQQIALTEKIIAVLPKMACPYQLEPHQIQGLDFLSIFPVIQWLGKKSVENRREKAKKLKEFAVSQFHNTFRMSSDDKARQRNLQLRENVARVEGVYGPKRTFRRKHVPENEDEATRIRVTLLEYGRRSIGRIRTNDGDEARSGGMADLESDASVEEIDIETLLKSLSITGSEEIDHLELTAADREKLRDHFEHVRSEMQIDSEELRLRNQLKELDVQQKQLESQLSSSSADLESLVNETTTIEDETLAMRREKEELLAEIQELKAKEEESDKSVLETVQTLIVTNETLKREEQEFKDRCRKELTVLQKTISDSETKSPEEDLEDLKKELQQELEIVQALRLQSAKQNRQIVTVQRQLDNIPDRTELAQYQKRFLELYNQVAAKHRETKQFFALYNTLNNTKMCLQKELTLLNSIYDGYNQALTSPLSREQFLKQLEATVASIGQMKQKQKLKCDEDKSRRDKLNDALLYLVDEQRRLASIVKQLQYEFTRNDELTREIQKIKS